MPHFMWQLLLHICVLCFYFKQFDPINIDSDDLDSEVDFGFFEHESDEPQNRIVQSDGQNPLDLPYTQAQPSTSGDQVG